MLQTDRISGKGTYILVLEVKHSFAMRIGKIGERTFFPGIYAYVGSAMGPGGLKSRISRHMRVKKKKHWHIDYLSANAIVADVYYDGSEKIREHIWAEIMERDSGSNTAIPGFGASDCKCGSHLYKINDAGTLYTRLKNTTPAIRRLSERR